MGSVSNFKCKQFGHGQGYYLDNHNMCKSLIMNIERELGVKWELFDIKGFNKYYVNFNQTGVDLIQNKSTPHMVTYYISQAKSCYLICTNFMEVPMTFYYFPHNGQFVRVRHRFHSSMYTKTTILEGQLISTTHESYFLIEDIPFMNGCMLVDNNLCRQRQILNSIFHNRKIVFDKYLDPVTITLKRYVETEYLSNFITDYIFSMPKSKKHRELLSMITGLQFRSVKKHSNRMIILEFKDKTGNLRRFNHNIFNLVKHAEDKNKTSLIMTENSSIDNMDKLISKLEIMVKEGIVPLNLSKCWKQDKNGKFNTQNYQWFDIKKIGPDTYILIRDSNIVGLACVPNIKLSKKLNSYPSDSLNTGKVKCQYVPRFKKWKPVEIKVST